MKSTPVQTVKSILGRIGIEYEDGLPEGSIYFRLERGCSDEVGSHMFAKSNVGFFNEVWENSVIALTENAGIILVFKILDFSLPDGQIRSQMSQTVLLLLEEMRIILFSVKE